MSKKPLLTYFGHHKCGTQWFKSIIADVCSILKLNYINHHNANQFDQDLKSFVEQNEMDFYSFINAQYRFVEQLDNYKGFHVVRDPRDIVVSGYFSHLHSHSTMAWQQLVDIREKLEKSSKEEGLMSEIDRSANLFKHLGNWDYNNSSIMEMKMEEMMGNPYERLVDIFRFLGLVFDKDDPDELKTKDRMPIGKFLAVVYYNRFSAKTKGREQGKEDVKHHYRKGVPGDWKNHFTDKHKKLFKEVGGELLIKLGYEKDMNW